MSEPADSKKYSLRTVIHSHTADVRSVCPLPNGGFITGSRDKTCKAYLPNDKDNGFNEVQIMIGPTNYVSSVCCITTVNQTLIYAGSNDSDIYCYSLNSSEPLYRLQDHSGTVCALSAHNERQRIISGSWDQTSRIWNEKVCEAVLVGHEGAVWATDFICEYAITGSADKTLKLWTYQQKVDCIATLKGHTDCIRAIAVISDTDFLSASNDASIRQWNVKGELIKEFSGHENYIYSITNIGRALEFVTCSEDRTVRFWCNESSTQTQLIRLPAPTLWSVACLTNDDIVVGSSTGKVYVFTHDENLVAPLEEQKVLEQELSKSTLHMNDIGDIKVKDLPDPQVLLAPGKRDGQTKMVRDGDKVSVHSWDAAKSQWTKIGDVVGAAGASHDPTHREIFEGKEYDYVFSVDIEDGAPPLQLPYNIVDDPWLSAQKFIDKHNLSQVYLDQIAHFIMKNSSGIRLDQISGGQNCDPFTGNSSYSSNSTSQPMDTSSPPESVHFPQTSHLKFESVNVEGMAKKLKEFSDKLPPEMKLESQDIQVLLKLSDISLEVQPEQLRLLRHMLSWPKNFIFPALDLIRASLLLPLVNEELCASKDSVRLVDTLLVCATDINSTPNQTVAFRALSNMFAHPVGEQLAITYASVIFKALSKFSSNNRNVLIALSTVYLNFAVSFQKTEPNPELKFECFTAIIQRLDSIVEPEAVYRLLIALGTLVHNDHNLSPIATAQEVSSTIKKFTTPSNPDKVAKCAKQLLELKG